MDNSLPMKGVTCSIARRTLIIKSASKLKVLGSAVLNSNLEETDTIINHQVATFFGSKNEQKYLRNVAADLGFNPDTTVGLMTAVDINKYAVRTLVDGGITVSAIVTAGISNPSTAGDTIIKKQNTINIVILTNANPSKGCFVNIIQTATEAKTAALREFDVRSRTSNRQATGTTSDAIIVGSNQSGKSLVYSGTATRLGELVGKAVLSAVKDGIQKTGFVPCRSLKDRLEEYGITVKELVKTWESLYRHHPSFGKRKRITELISEDFERALVDVNVSSLILAGLKLEEEGNYGLLPGLGKRFKEDPVDLVADELLGLAIAEYIAGSRGIFEFYRFDRLKPGLLGKLGPFADDIIGGLVSGVSSNLYTRLLSRRS